VADQEPQLKKKSTKKRHRRIGGKEPLQVENQKNDPDSQEEVKEVKHAPGWVGWNTSV